MSTWRDLPVRSVFQQESSIRCFTCPQAVWNLPVPHAGDCPLKFLSFQIFQNLIHSPSAHLLSTYLSLLQARRLGNPALIAATGIVMFRATSLPAPAVSSYFSRHSLLLVFKMRLLLSEHVISGSTRPLEKTGVPPSWACVPVTSNHKSTLKLLFLPRESSREI